MAFDWLIRGGTVLDGTGAPGRRADVALSGDRVTAVAPDLPGEAGRVVDATGCMVVPGFIDMHAHSDFALLAYPSAEAKVRQGVTTEVTGMCGFSPAPAPPGGGLLREWAAFLSPQLDWQWTSFGSWLDRLRQAGLTGNVVPFVGHGTLRIAAMGFEQRPPTADEARRMAALLGEALDAGAFGLSTGLIYAPSVYADTAELVALARVAGSRAGRLYSSHIRGEGPTLEAAIAEAIRIGDEGGVPVQISHLKACLKANWPKMGEALQTIERARARGIDVTADMYPYTAGSTTLASLLPVWVHEGGMAALLGRLADGSTRRRILDAGRVSAGGWGGPNGAIEWPDVMVAECPRVPGGRGPDDGRDRGRPAGPGGGRSDRPPPRGRRAGLDDQLLDARRQRRPGPPVPPRNDRLRQPRALRGTRGAARRETPPSAARVLREGARHLRPRARGAQLGGQRSTR